MTEENSKDENTTTELEVKDENKEEKSRGIIDRTPNKVVVHNVLKFQRKKDEIDEDIKSWLSHANPPNSIKVFTFKKVPKQSFIKLTLEEEKMVEPFLQLFKDHELKNRHGHNLVATRPYDNKRGREGDGAEEDNKRRKVEDVRDVTIPLHNMSYEEQLECKQKDMIRNSAVKIVREINKAFRDRKRSKKHDDNIKVWKPFKWLCGKGAIHVSEIIPSPEKYHYRNKVEYTFGYQHENDTETPTVGFMIRGWSGGVSKPTKENAPHVPEEGYAIANVFEEFLKSSTVPIYNSKTHEGVWRNIAIRISKVMNQCMIIILYAPPSNTEALEKEKLTLVKMLKKKTKVTSIYYQEYDGVSNPNPNDVVDDKLKLYYGSETFQEKLKSCVYTLSPFGSFFQVNTKGAEVLYDVVIKYCREVIDAKKKDEKDALKDKEEIKDDTEKDATNEESKQEETEETNGESKETKKKVILLDVCCGTGTIGLTCLKENMVDYVIGIDISQPAIRDAIRNAKENNVKVIEDNSALLEDDEPKVKFIASKAEAVLENEIESIYKLFDPEEVHIIAVVDPARDGLHKSVLKTLRNTEGIQRIIYVSCNPTGSLVNDVRVLCSFPTNRYVGRPFRPVVAQPVDMFPWTKHCELVMVLDRNGDFDVDDHQ